MPPLPGLHLVSGVDERRRSSVRVHCVLSGFGVLGVGVWAMSMYTCTVSCGVPASALHSSSGRRSQHFAVCLLTSGVPRFSPFEGVQAADGFTKPTSCRGADHEPRGAKMVGNIRFLTLVKPVLHVLPEVAQPDRKIPFKARLPA